MVSDAWAGKRRGKEVEGAMEKAICGVTNVISLSLSLSSLPEVLLHGDEPVLILVVLPEQSRRLLARHVHTLRWRQGYFDINSSGLPLSTFCLAITSRKMAD